MSTRTRAARQCEGQLWLTFEWPKQTDRVAVCCVDCSWRGRRARQGATVRPCPRCAGRVWPGVRRTQGSRAAGGRTRRDGLRVLAEQAGAARSAGVAAR
jgi:hypothetical protein